jgi:serine/threonine-protein kinase
VSVQGEVARPTRLGRYELITRIGQGGMAEVQLALQRGPAGFEKLVVVKLVHDTLATQKAFVDMLLDEARLAALVKHPNVVDIYDLGQAEGRYFIAMEYLEGEPLLAVLRAGREGKRLDPLSTGRLIADTAEGLDAAHELRSMSGERIELVHHDISLGNIVVLYNGQVKLVDFGVAKASLSASTGAKVQGKFSYMAPEKLKGAAGDRRSDIFSLGCVMWEALTLRRLFRGGNDTETMRQVLELSIQAPSKVNGDVPVEYDAIVMRALDRDPEKRHLTAKEMAVEIEEVLRKRGYGAKNDRIAKYMQETFKSHIDARKHLVQEVVAKGSASAEVLDAAFKDAAMANGTPGASQRGDFTLGRLLVTPPAGIPQQAPATGVPQAPSNGDGSGATVVGKPPWEIHTNVDVPALDADGGETVFQPPLPRWAAIVEDPRKRRLVAGGGGFVLLLAIIAIAKCGGGSGETTQAAAAVPADAAQVAVAPPVVDAAAVVTIDADVAPVIDAAEVTPPPPPVHHAVERRPAPSTADAEALYKEGVQAMVRGDNKGSIAALTKATRVRPGYAPAWRVLGQVYKKLGEKGQARAAFQRYLSIAPGASDAAQIRDQIKSL